MSIFFCALYFTLTFCLVPSHFPLSSLPVFLLHTSVWWVSIFFSAVCNRYIVWTIRGQQLEEDTKEDTKRKKKGTISVHAFDPNFALIPCSFPWLLTFPNFTISVSVLFWSLLTSILPQYHRTSGVCDVFHFCVCLFVCLYDVFVVYVYVYASWGCFVCFPCPNQMTPPCRLQPQRAQRPGSPPSAAQPQLRNAKQKIAAKVPRTKFAGKRLHEGEGAPRDCADRRAGRGEIWSWSKGMTTKNSSYISVQVHSI